MPRSHPLATRARPPGPPGAQTGLGSGSLKSVVRACFLLPQSRAPLLFFSSRPSRAPALLYDTTRQDSTQSGSDGALLINVHLAASQPFHPSDVVINRRRHQPTVELTILPYSRKNTRESPRLDRNPTKTQSHTHPRPTLARLNLRDPGRRSTQPASNTGQLLNIFYQL